MSGCRRNMCGWLVVLLVGCDMLPPPPPPKLRTAAPVAPQPNVDPKLALGPHTGPGHFQVKFETTKGDFVVEVHREWAPNGADRFKQLVEEGFYDGCKFFRVLPNFVVQWGMNGDPETNAKYQNNKIPDDKRAVPNSRGTIVFATSGPDSRTSQLFVNMKDNAGLDAQNFAPFGRVVQGMEEVIGNLNGEYEDEITSQQQTIAQVGNVFLDERYPNLDYIIKATIIDPHAKPAAKEESKDEKTEAEPVQDAKDGDAAEKK
jgi:peptidyl-prolyl cis-trans isomerase A (cyclophilin A)